MGNKFDEEGNLNNWWSDEDQNKFDIKSKYYVDEFNKLTVNGKNVNGKLTLGENLADHGGLKIAYYALNKHLKETKNIEKISNFSPNERFFISWGKVWKSNITPEEAASSGLEAPPAIAETVYARQNAHHLSDPRINKQLSNYTGCLLKTKMACAR